MDRSFNESRNTEAIDADYAWCGGYLYDIQKRIGVVFPLIRNCLVDTSLFLLFFVFAIGFYDGFLGPGTGSFLMFSLLFIGYDFLKAAGNAKLLNLGSNVGALLMFMYVGQVNYAYGFIMGIAQIAGGIVGSKFAIKKGSGYVRALFITVTCLLLAKNLYDYIQ